MIAADHDRRFYLTGTHQFIKGQAGFLTFSLSEPADTGHGLRGMNERVTSMGGRLVARPRPSGGFQVTVVLPLSGAGAGG